MTAALTLSTFALLTHGAAFEAVPVSTFVLEVVAVLGLALAALFASFRRSSEPALSALLISSWLTVNGSVLRVRVSQELPADSVAHFDWTLVYETWPTIFFLWASAAVLFVASRYERSPSRRLTLRVFGAWASAHAWCGSMERLGAFSGAPAWVEETLCLLFAVGVAVASSCLIWQRGVVPEIRFSWLPCVVIVLWGPAHPLRGALAPEIRSSAALAELVSTGGFGADPLEHQTPARLVPLNTLIVLSDGRRLALTEGRLRALGRREVWAPPQSGQPSAILIDRELEVARLERALASVGTRRAVLASVAAPSPRRAWTTLSARAATQQAVVRYLALVMPVDTTPCLDLRALPPAEPAMPQVASARCVANLDPDVLRGTAVARPPRPWLPGRPSAPLALLMLLTGLSLAVRAGGLSPGIRVRRGLRVRGPHGRDGQGREVQGRGVRARDSLRLLAAVGLCVALFFAGAAAFRLYTGAMPWLFEGATTWS